MRYLTTGTVICDTPATSEKYAGDNKIINTHILGGEK